MERRERQEPRKMSSVYICARTGRPSGLNPGWASPMPPANAQIRSASPVRRRKVGPSVRGPVSDPCCGVPGAAFERHYRVLELARLWGFSDRTIIKLFSDESGVIRLAP